MIEMLRIYSNGFLENVAIKELTPGFPMIEEDYHGDYNLIRR
jgi:hypothetical protein